MEDILPSSSGGCKIKTEYEVGLVLYINKLNGSNHQIVILHLIDRHKYIIIMQTRCGNSYLIMIIHLFIIRYTIHRVSRQAWLE